MQIQCPRSATTLLTLALSAVLATACQQPEGCLSADDPRCVPPPACEGLDYTCADTSVGWRKVGRLSDRPAGLAALASRGDIILENALVRIVIDALDHPHYLAPTGGNVLDAVRLGDGESADGLNVMTMVTGILPEDAVAYDHLEIIEGAVIEGAGEDGSTPFVAVVVRGALAGRPDTTVVTRYELRPCEPGLRIRTELFHGGRDPYTYFLADGFWWGGREATPFVPLDGQGFTHPTLSLLEIDKAFRTFPFMAAYDHVHDASSYAIVPCSDKTLDGFQSDTVSAVGAPKAVFVQGDGIAYERFFVIGRAGGLASGVDEALEARRQLFGEAYATVSGTTRDSAGDPVGGSERVASLLVYEPATSGAPDDPDARRPWTEVIPASDGSFEFRVPADRALAIEPRSFGRVAGDPVTLHVDAVATGAEVVVEDVMLPSPARLTVAVVDAAGEPLAAEIVLAPTGDTLVADVSGDIYGFFAKDHCAPWLGPPHGAAPACNRALVWRWGPSTLDVPAGSYQVYATRGPFWTLARERVDLTAGSAAEISLTLAPLAGLVPADTLSADLHVHAGLSFDGSMPLEERALTFETQGLDVIAATEHDVVTDFAEAVEFAGVGDTVRVMAGVESTTEILFFTPPGETIPKAMGHFNFWPLQFDPLAWRGGAPVEEEVEPGELYDRAAALFDGEGVLQLNHPLGDSTFGRDHGYIQAMGYDPRDTLPSGPKQTPAGVLLRRPGGEDGHRNIDHDVQEVMNGSTTKQFLRYRPLWFSFLSQGVLRAGTANSDSHTLGEEVLGSPRNLVSTDTTVAEFDADAFNRAVKDGRMIGTNGPVLTVSIRDADDVPRGPSLTSLQPASDATLDISVVAAPWMVVEEARIIVNGEVARRLEVDSDAVAPDDPFGDAPVVRINAQLPLADLLDGISGDIWIVVEAGRPLWPAADLDDDGVPDTTDTNGDGVIDIADQVDPDDSDTWWQEPPRPEPDAPGYHQWLMAPGTWTTAFSNPLLIDRDGDGWDAPGLPASDQDVGGAP